MERRDVLVEIGRKEIQTSDAGRHGIFVVTQYIVEVVCSFGGDRSDLLVASGVSGDEEHGYSTKLKKTEKTLVGGAQQ